jgi:hypothetical protein
MKALTPTTSRLPTAPASVVSPPRIVMVTESIQVTGK